MMGLSKKNTRLTVGGALVALLLVLMIQNSAATSLHFIFVRFELPLFLVVLLSAAIGFGIGWLLRRHR